MNYGNFKAIAVVLLLVGSGCDTSSETEALPTGGATPVAGTLSFATSQAFADAIAKAEDRSDEERTAWESERGFTSLRSSREVEATAGLAARGANPDDGTAADDNQDPAVASLLNADGEVLIDGYTLRVRDGVSRLLSPDGKQVAETPTYREQDSDGSTAARSARSAGFTTFVQKYFGGDSPIADKPAKPDQTRFLMNSKLYFYNYIVYATYGGYTGSEEFLRGRFGGRGWSESRADVIAINCTLSNGETRFQQLTNYSKADVDFGRRTIDPISVVLFQTTAGAPITIANVRAACNHSVRITRFNPAINRDDTSSEFATTAN